MNTTPEHLHVMLNHIPIVGFAVVAVLLLYALILKERHTLVVGLGLCALLAVMTSVVMWTGEEAHGRLENGSLALLLDEPGGQWMETHEGRAEYAAVLSYIVGGLAGVGLVIGLVAASWRRRVAGFMLVMVLLTVGSMAWVADAGGKVRHPEFRTDGGSGGETGKENAADRGGNGGGGEAGEGDAAGGASGEGSAGESEGTTAAPEAGQEMQSEPAKRESDGEGEASEQGGGGS